MKAISLWQPWAWAILHAGKDVENRTWPTQHRGSLLLHAAKRRPTSSEIDNFLFCLQEINGSLFDELDRGDPVGMLWGRLLFGGIVGHVRVTDCVRGHESPWAFDEQYQWIVENPTPLPFKAVKGERGFFEVDYEGIVEPPKKQTKQTELF